MATINPFRYTSRTYRTLLADINTDADLVDKPDWFKRLIAGIGDVISMWLNAEANEAYLGTAQTRRAVVELCRQLDYELTAQEAAAGIVLFYLSSTTVFPITVTAANLAALTEGTTDQSALRYEARSPVTQAATSETFTADAGTDKLTVARVYTTGEKVRLTTSNTLPAGLSTATDYYVIKVNSTEIRLATTIANAYLNTYINITGAGVGVHTIHLYSIQVTCYEQQTYASAIIGRNENGTDWFEVDTPILDVLIDTETVVINGVTWTRVDTFIDSTGSDKHYRLLYNSDNSSFLQFGNGTYGEIPGDFDIYFSCYYGGGARGNIANANRIKIYAGADASVVGVSNPSTMIGGSDPESIASAKLLAPLLLKSRDRFVTPEDGEILCLAYGGISLAKVQENFYGPLSARVVCIATGGGNPGAGVKTALQTYLIDRSVLGSMDVRVEDTTITNLTIQVQVKVRSGWIFADIQAYVELACYLLFDDQGQELKVLYEESGTADAVTWINATWGFAFISTDYNQVQILLENYVPLIIGNDAYQEADFLGFIDQYVEGVQYPEVTAPAFPYTFAADGITSVNVLTVTEIP